MQLVDPIKHTRQHIANLDHINEGAMLALWKQGYDTYDIAKKLGLLEWQVANELPRLREAIRNTGRVS